MVYLRPSLPAVAKRGKGTKIMAIAAGSSVPLAAAIDSPSPHGSRLVGEMLADGFLYELPARPTTPTRSTSAWTGEHGVERIAPNRAKPVREPGRQADAAPLGRGAAVRLAAMASRMGHALRHAENFLGMIRLGCMKITPRFL